jgi:hypothetical protein
MSKMGINQVKIGNIYNTEEYYCPEPEKKKGVMRYFFTGDDCSVALHMIPPKLKPLPEHKHPHEQFLIVPQGDGKALINGEEYDSEPGFFAYIPSDIPHGYDTSEATYTCWNFDIFYPERLEYEEDNYFRIMAQGKNPMDVMITKETKK